MSRFSPPKKNKYGNKKVVVDGIKFDSKLEAAVYLYYTFRLKKNEITDLKMQVPVILQPGNQKTKISMVVDFSYIDAKTGELIYAEAKGAETTVYRLKLKLWRYKNPGRLVIWKGTHTKYFVDEIIGDANDV